MSGDLKNIRESLRNSLTLESDWESLYLTHFSGIRTAARKLGINLDTARIINTKRRKMTPDAIMDVSQDKHQWYSIGTAWLDWIQGEMPDWLAPCTYVVEFGQEPLMVNSKESVAMFEQKYILDVERPKDKAIDWKLLYENNVGAVEFSPYDRSFENTHLSWYDSIDMASGAIVNKKIIKRIIKLYDGTEDFIDAGVKI